MDDEKQKDEIIALKSIYNEEEFSDSKDGCHYQCIFKIFLVLPLGYYVTYRDLRHEECGQKVKISHLPPLSLHVVLPKDYPSTSPPKFALSTFWLSQSALTKLCKKLDKLWKEDKGHEILFVWVAFLQYEALEFLNSHEYLVMSDAYTEYNRTLEKAQIPPNSREVRKEEEPCGNLSRKTEICEGARYTHKGSSEQKHLDTRAIVEHLNGRNPIAVLIEYNEKRNQIQFNKNIFTCKICFMDKCGEHCMQFLPCSHVFCKECISGYLEVRIKDGNVQNICCPEEKCTSEAIPGQIKDLVSSELFTKYDSILLSATLDTMSDIMYCPRQDCQYPVTREPNEQMANCPACQYAFCVYCKMVYHGIEPCRINSMEKQKLVAEYQTGSHDKRAQIEQRYGKMQLQVLVDNTMSENWINTNSHPCPQCNVAIEKLGGCNKMVCWRCNTDFCWLCSTMLDRNRPYEHYEDRLSKCRDMLFHGVDFENEENEGNEEDVEGDEYSEDDE